MISATIKQRLQTYFGTDSYERRPPSHGWSQIRICPSWNKQIWQKVKTGVGGSNKGRADSTWEEREIREEKERWKKGGEEKCNLCLTEHPVYDTEKERLLFSLCFQQLYSYNQKVVFQTNDCLSKWECISTWRQCEMYLLVSKGVSHYW